MASVEDAWVNVTNIVISSQQEPFEKNYTFNISYECLRPIPSDLNWKVIYVGSAESAEYDITLLDVDLDPHKVAGTYKLPLNVTAPSAGAIKDLGLTVILITCSFKGQEFIRVGYWMNVFKDDTGVLKREILAEKPRVTRFPIYWNGDMTDDDMSDDVSGDTPPAYMIASKIDLKI